MWLICVWVIDGEAWGSCRDLVEVQLLHAGSLGQVVRDKHGEDSAPEKGMQTVPTCP